MQTATSTSSIARLRPRRRREMSSRLGRRSSGGVWSGISARQVVHRERGEEKKQIQDGKPERSFGGSVPGQAYPASVLTVSRYTDRVYQEGATEQQRGAP